MSDPRLKRIKIAAGVLKRCGKMRALLLTFFSMGQEREANHKELAHQLVRIEKLKADGQDEWTIRKQVRSFFLHG